MHHPVTIQVPVSEGQHQRLKEAKGERSWREAMLEEFGVREEPDE